MQYRSNSPFITGGLGAPAVDSISQAAETYRVVLNHEGQYAIWPAQKPIPENWRDAGFSGSKEACLAQIREVWTDMRPFSQRSE